MIRRLSIPQLVVDIAVPSVVFLALFLHYFAPTNGWVRIVVLAGMCAAFAMRRLSPAIALTFAWGASLWQVAFTMDPDPMSIAILPVLYATARYGSDAVKWAGLISAGVGALVIAAYVTMQGFSWLAYCLVDLNEPCRPEDIRSLVASAALTFLLAATAFVLSWTFGLLAKTYDRARASNAARRAAEQSVVIEQERNRIARDMHDVVAHSLAVVIAQADGARYARGKQPDAVDSAFETISSTARDALADVRVLLAQLRRAESHAPQRALADLDRLVGQFRASGLDVVVNRDGEPDEPGLGLELAVYRIVQEALTNALRHGDAADPVVVDFDWRSTDVRLRISNTVGADRAVAELGHGLAGMRERAQLAGGSFEVSDDGETFTVVVTLPLGTGVAS